MYLLKLLTENKVKILTETNVIEITDKCDKQGNLGADTVVLALGFKPNDKLYRSIKDKLPNVHLVGDCREPRKVINAIWEGFRIARLV